MKYNAKNLAKALLKSARENPTDQQKVLTGFFDFCAKKKLEYVLPSLMRYIKIEGKRENDVKTLKIFSAIKLDNDTIKKIQNACQADLNSPTEVIEDKEIIAGFVACYKNKIIDASLSNSLRLLKNKIIA